MVSFAGGVTVTYQAVTVGKPDDRGNDTYEAVNYTVNNCVWVPEQTSESTQGAEEIIGNAKLYLVPPDGVTPTPLDRILYSGHTYQVTGDPSQWTSPFTSLTTPVMLNLREVTGGSAHTSSGSDGD
jgi:hypothetical protein